MIVRVTDQEFTRRLGLHTLPTGFHRIRYAGLYRTLNRNERMETIRAAYREAIGSEIQEIDQGARDRVFDQFEQDVHSGFNQADETEDECVGKIRSVCSVCNRAKRVVYDIDGPLMMSIIQIVNWVLLSSLAIVLGEDEQEQRIQLGQLIEQVLREHREEVENLILRSTRLMGSGQCKELLDLVLIMTVQRLGERQQASIRGSPSEGKVA